MVSQSPKKGSALVTAIIIFLVILVALYVIGAAQGENKERVSQLKENAAASVSSRGGEAELDFGPRLFTAFDNVYSLLEDFDKKTGFNIKNIRDSEISWAKKEGEAMEKYKAKEASLVFSESIEAEEELDQYFRRLGLEKREASYIHEPKNKEATLAFNYSKPNAFCFIQADLIASVGTMICGIID